MIKSVIRAYVFNVFALWAVAQFIDGFQLAEGLKSLLLVGAGFTVLHLIVKPILHMFLGMLNVLTLGLIGVAIDSGLLYALTQYFPQVSIVPWYFPGFDSTYITLPPYDFNVIATTVISALVINVIRSVLSSLTE